MVLNTLHALLLATLPAPAHSLPSVALGSVEPSRSNRSFLLGGGAPLTIECPVIAKFECGGSTDPDDIGYPTVTGGCDPNPTVTYSDATVPGSGCAASRFDVRIVRTWTASDSCGNVVSCEQHIDVVKTVGFLDIKPESCPNPFNLGSGGILQMSILGTATFDVTTIDPATIQLWTLNCASGPVVPVSWGYEDTGTPYTVGDLCGCHTLGGDGYTDLRLRFSKSAMEAGLGLGNQPLMSSLKLFVSAQLASGCGFVASDCIRIQ